MATCHCDGPPHTYDPSWCRAGRGDNGLPIAGATGNVPGLTIIVNVNTARN